METKSTLHPTHHSHRISRIGDIPVLAPLWYPPPDNPFTLQVKPSRENLTGYDGASAPKQGQSFLGRRQEHSLFTYSVDLNFSPSSVGEEAGVTVFLQQDRHIDMGLALLSPNGLYIRVRGMSNFDLPSHQTPLPQAWIGETLHLEIKAFNWTHYSFSAGPADAMSQLETFAYYPNSVVSSGFTGMSCPHVLGLS